MRRYIGGGGKLCVGLMSNPAAVIEPLTAAKMTNGNIFLIMKGIGAYVMNFLI